MTARADWMPEVDHTPDVAPAALAAVMRACEEYDVAYGEVMGRSRSQRVVMARHQAMTELYFAGWSLSELGRVFGRDHTTVLSAVRKAKRVRVAT